MESGLGMVKRADCGQFEVELPPGFRFHPTDEELITHYLAKKVVDCNFSAIAIGEVDMNKIEPWDLPWQAKIGEKEWYFFCVRDKKYPTGLRTNRATAAGYWKATGKDKEIFREKSLVGMKKTLVFYKGRAPKGEKSNWVTHEYRLDGALFLDILPSSTKNDWVISRVFHKTNGGKKVHISGLMRMDSVGHEMYTLSSLPPLMDPPSYDGKTEPIELDSGHVTCFSNAQKNEEDNLAAYFNNPTFPSSSDAPMAGAFSWGQFQPQFDKPGVGFSGSIPFQDPPILRTLVGNSDQNMNEAVLDQNMRALSMENSSVLSDLEMGKEPFGGQEGVLDSMETQDLDNIWSY